MHGHLATAARNKYHASCSGVFECIDEAAFVVFFTISAETSYNLGER